MTDDVALLNEQYTLYYKVSADNYPGLQSDSIQAFTVQIKDGLLAENGFAIAVTPTWPHPLKYYYADQPATVQIVDDQTVASLNDFTPSNQLATLTYSCEMNIQT